MSLLKPRTQTLYVTAQGLIALSHQYDSIKVAARFEAPDEESGHAISESPVIGDFQEWVAQHRHDLFTLLIDHVDEQQLVEDIPRLSRRDRETLIAKRAAQRFRDSEFITHQLIERVTDNKRKSHRIAMMALKSSVPIAPWIDVLLEQQVRIRRITSPTLLADPLMRRLAPGQTGLLVSHNPSGLRQTLLINGGVRFSRLARLKAFEASQVSDEIQRSLQYLIMTQRLTRAELDSQRFRVWIIDDGIANATAFPSKLKLDSGAEVSIRLLSAPRLGLPTLPGDAALGLWAGVGMQQAGGRDYGNTRTRIFDQIHQWKLRLWGGSIAVAIIGALMAFFVDEAVEVTIPDTQHVVAQTSELNDRIHKLEDKLATYPLAPQDLTSSVAIVKRIRSHEIDPLNLYAAIATAWQGNAELTLTEISFEPLNQSSKLTSDNFAANGAAGRTAAASSLLNADRRFVIAGLTNKSLTRSRANELVGLLATRLSRHCDCSIDEVLLPHDPTPDTGLTGVLPESNAKRGEFRITMVQGGSEPLLAGANDHVRRTGSLIATATASIPE